MSIRVQEYVREDGSSPFKTWFDGLDAQAAAKVATAVMRLSAGNTSRVKWFGASASTASTGDPGTGSTLPPMATA
jgi:hypothetical protein